VIPRRATTGSGPAGAVRARGKGTTFLAAVIRKTFERFGGPARLVQPGSFA
jgi:hypothetical protein